MGIRGDFRALKRLSKQLGEAASGKPLRDLAAALGEEAVTQVKVEFEEGRDPYGEAWRPLANATLKSSPRRIGGKILLDSGRLRRSFNRVAMPGGFAVESNVKYAAIHDFGGMAGRGRKVKIPRRQILPSREPTGLGRRWETAFRKVSGTLVRRYFRR